jgi:hypothetical protein
MSQNSISNLSYKEMLTICQTNKDLSKQWITYLYKKYLPHINNLEIERPLISIMGFAPLPYYFQTSYFSDVDKIVNISS